MTTMGPDFVGGGPRLYGPLIAVAILVAVLLLRNSRPRKLRIELLWLRPILFALIIAFTLSASSIPLDGPSLGVFALAAIVGVALGWQRGRLMTIEVDPQTHALTSRASPIGMIFIVAILLLRMALRGAALESQSALGLPAAAITDGLILLLGAMIVTQSLEMWLRARRLLAEARAAKAIRDVPGSRPPLVS
jgi:hypothetical protein